MQHACNKLLVLILCAVQKVVNRCGPQVKTKPLPQKLTEAQFSCSASTQQSEVQKAASGETLLPPGVEERISNMERHVKLYNGKSYLITEFLYCSR